jgi:hypothetical protein
MNSYTNKGNLKFVIFNFLGYIEIIILWRKRHDRYFT